MALERIDTRLWEFLALDILRAAAEVQLPPPPRVPSFERETVRPGKAVSQ